MITALTEHMSSRIQAATTPAGMVDAYLVSLISYMGAHPRQVRIIAEALDNDTGIEDRPTSAARWKPLADLSSTAQRAGNYAAGVDARMLAIILGRFPETVTR